MGCFHSKNLNDPSVNTSLKKLETVVEHDDDTSLNSNTPTGDTIKKPCLTTDDVEPTNTQVTPTPTMNGVEPTNTQVTPTPTMNGVEPTIPTPLQSVSKVTHNFLNAIPFQRYVPPTPKKTNTRSRSRSTSRTRIIPKRVHSKSQRRLPKKR